MVRVRRLFAGVMMLCGAGSVSAETPVQSVDIGVLATHGDAHAIAKWQPTIDWLTARIPTARFELHPMNLDEMSSAVKLGTMDFILTNPGQAVRLGRQYALSWIATLSLSNPESPSYAIGSALVIRRDAPYKGIAQLSGKPIAAVSEMAFGGYLTLRYQLLEMDIDPNRFFSQVQFSEYPIDKGLYQLRDGGVDAAVVPVCLLENMVAAGKLDAGQFRVVNPMPNHGLGCQVSTHLYPNWSFAKTESGSVEMATQISRALFAMPSDSPALVQGGYAGWTTPVSMLSIDKLYHALDLHPFQQPWWQNALRWLRQHQEWAWGLLVLVLVLNVYHFWLEFRFSKSKKALEQTLLRLKEKSELLEHSQRVAVVGELGSSLAHELNQPLTAIRNYSEGGLLRLAKHRPHEDIVPVLENIQQQVERADAIVQRLRNLIKKRSIDMQPTNIETLIDDTIELMRFRMQKQAVTLVRKQEGPARLVDVDYVGIQQALVNLLNNAIDACELQRHEMQACYQGKVLIKTEYLQDVVVIRVTDNGTGLKHENPTKAFVSTKQQGLGLGLAICIDVMELHGGEFAIRNVQPHGCMAGLTLPYLQTANRPRSVA